MNVSRVVLALAVILGVLAWLAAQQTIGQQPSPGIPPASPVLVPPTVMIPDNPGYPRYGEMDPRMGLLMAEESRIDQEVAGLVVQYARTEKEGEREKLKQKLADALAKQFDAQQKRRDEELSRAEEKLKKLRELMKKRGEERKAIIDRRADQLLREAEGLGWAPPQNRPTALPGMLGGSYTVPASK